MGTLNSCLKSKSLYRDGNKDFVVGTASMQGLRLSQEDAHKVLFSLEKHTEWAFFGVFDGHGGEKTSHFLEQNIINALDENEFLDSTSITESMLKLDMAFINENNSEVRDQGSTCIFALVKKIGNADEEKYEINCVNVGDSRCILIRKNGSWEALSNDHKPHLRSESKRIKDAGGYVVSNRVDGTLAVSRAFGDYNLKDNPNLAQRFQKVIAEPEIIQASCSQGDIMLICCDGIFENLENKTVAKCIIDNFHKHKDPAKMLSQLFDIAEESGSSDNMTGILVHFSDGNATAKGPQFVPGPLYRSRDDKQFFETYTQDAMRSGYAMDNILRLVAYHQDLTKAMHYSSSTSSNEETRNKLMREISLLSPWRVSLENLAFLINSLDSTIVISAEAVEGCKAKGVDSVEKMKELLENKQIGSLGLDEGAVRSISLIFAMWRTLPPVVEIKEEGKENTPETKEH